MSATAEHFASIDAQLASARAAWEKDRVDLQDRIIKLELEIAHAKDREREAISGRIAAEKNTAALSALFGVVRHVLEEAARTEINKIEAGKTPSETVAAMEPK